jgi:signal transduction histidine kinase
LKPPFVATDARAGGTRRRRLRRRFDIVPADDLRVVLPDEAVSTSLEYLQSVKRLWPPARRYWFDALVLAGLAIGISVPVHDVHAKNRANGPLWFDVLAVVLCLLPLFFRRRFPFGAPVAVGVAVVASTFVDDRLVPTNFIFFLLACAAAFLVGLLRDRRRAVAGLALVVGADALVNHADPQGQIGTFVFSSLVFTVVWTIGFALGRKFQETDEAKERAARAELEREERAYAAVAEERARIARELHDVVGHSVSVMTVQASAARRLLEPEQKREREALLVVEQTGREALAEMRRMVGVLRRPEEGPALAPQPSLEHLDRLVEQTREAGLAVEFRVVGQPVQLPTSVDLTAYRLVQEGLTNALKHARAQRAEVVVRYSNGQVELTVSDDGRGGGDGGGSGHGLVGMRERVSVYGGELEAGPRPEGGYRLRARLPVE